MKKWFQRKNILFKLLMIGWLSILLIVLPSFLIMSYFLKKSELADQIHAMTDSVIIQMLNARIAEKKFILHDLHAETYYRSGTSDNLETHQRLTQNVHSAIAHLMQLEPLRRKTSVDLLVQHFYEYNRLFNELVAAYRHIGFKDWGVLGRWRGAAHTVEHQIARLQRPDLQEALLQLRRLEKDYLLRKDETYLQAIREQLLALQHKTASIAGPERAVISANLQKYETALQTFMDLQQKIGRSEAEGLQARFNQVIENMDILVEQITAESRTDYENAKHNFRLMSLCIYVLGIGVGSLCYYFFARSVSMQLIALKNGVLRVGKGRLDTRVPVTADDEIGIVSEAFNKMTADLQQITVSKAYVDNIIESMADMLIATDAVGKIEKINPAAAKLLGYKEPALLERDMQRIISDQQIGRFLFDKIRNSRTLRNFETELVCKDGHRLSVSLSGSPMPERGGFVFVIQDNTERKHSAELLQQSEKELRLLSSRILEAQESERKHVARELHDGIGQALSGIKFAVENGIRKLRSSRAGADVKALEDIVPLIQSTVDETRRIAMGLRPSTLDDIGIAETIYWFCQQFESIYEKIRVRKFIEVEEDRIPESLKTVIFRVVQEAFNNVAKHSGADQIQLTLRQLEASVELCIEDNGGGFAPNRFRHAGGRGLGLSGMRERVELSGGTLAIETAPARATRVCAQWRIQAS